MGCGCSGPRFTDDSLGRELPSDADVARFGYGDEFVNCEECGEEMYDDSEMCPHCGAFQMGSAAIAGPAGRMAGASHGGGGGKILLPIVVILLIAGFLLLTTL